MNIYDASEYAYKNGYEAGVKNLLMNQLFKSRG